MASNILIKWRQAFFSFEQHFRLTFGLQRFPDDLSVALTNNHPIPTNTFSRKEFSIKDIIGEGILWAVPKKRRTLERRQLRRFGMLDRHFKMLIPKTDIITCNVCGHDYERRHLCGNCYAKVKKETESIKEKIEAELGLEPVEQEVIVLYKGEKEQQPSEYWQGKRIVEIDKERPAWFSKNLMEKSTAGTSDCVDVKPTELA
nr:PREDICTED: 39S ribosomal protein L32, mitochondrial [Bemisia tabaci]